MTTRRRFDDLQDWSFNPSEPVRITSGEVRVTCGGCGADLTRVAEGGYVEHDCATGEVWVIEHILTHLLWPRGPLPHPFDRRWWHHPVRAVCLCGWHTRWRWPAAKAEQELRGMHLDAEKRSP